jgi:hypothetical protein
VRRAATETIFVGELSPQVDRAELVSQLRSRRRGPVPALGRLVLWENFRNYAQVEVDERVEVLLAESEGDVVALTEVLVEPARALRAGEEDFEPKANAVYLPTFGTATAHASRESLTSKPKGYLQLVLDPERALAEYVATLLNSQLGRALRESVSSGGVRSTIRRSSVEQLRLPLPDIAAQRNAAAAQALIRGLRLELDGLERRLAADPSAVAEVVKAVSELGQRDPLTSFREALPFPLASIIWRYEADAEIKAKVDHLHRFFEASAIYFATVLLSAFMSDPELFNEHQKRWRKKLRANSFEHSSFGTWTLFGRLMTKSARGLLSGSAADRGRLLAAFAVDSERFADAVAGHALWDLLDEAKDERNKSKGHGGLPGPVEHENTHARLGGLLTNFGELLAEPFGDVVLVRPGAGRYRHGVNYYERAEVLQGPNNIFRQAELQAIPHMEDEGLYLVAADARPAGSALKLEPFVRLRPSPRSAENACYFYAEILNGEVEFVSHHFEGEPRISEPDAEVVDLINALQADEAAS